MHFSTVGRATFFRVAHKVASVGILVTMGSLHYLEMWSWTTAAFWLAVAYLCEAALEALRPGDQPPHILV